MARNLASVCPNVLETLRVGAYLTDRLISKFEQFDSTIGWKNEFTVQDVAFLKEWLDHAATMIEQNDPGSQVAI